MVMETKTEKTDVKKQRPVQDESTDVLVRIFGQDMPGSKSIYVGLTRIKGISWAVANALCFQLKLVKHTRVKDLSKDTIAQLERGLRNLQLPTFLQNRRHDPDTGVNKHLLTNDLDIQREFDIKRLRKIKSYRGVRHAQGLPVRGQRTRSHFRKKKGVSVATKKKDDSKA